MLHEIPSTRLIGRRLVVLDRVDSTNSIARGYAADLANDGLVIIADEQTAGRGRMGRTWSAPPGTSILCSVLLFPPERLRRPAVLTVLAAVAVCETIFDRTKLQATIKWPNDVYVRGRKVCGILVEQGQGTVLGIGLNVNTPAGAFATADLNQAGSLAMCTGGPLDRDAVCTTLLQRLDSIYADLLEGRQDDLESRWRWHSSLLGRQVEVKTHDGAYQGRLLELSFAAISVQDQSNQLRHFVPEKVEQLTLFHEE